MSGSRRAAQFEKLFKVLRKYYKPVFPDPDLPVLHHLLRACCLENASYQAAETALTALFHEFFDLNEIRVSTVRELAEVMACLPDPAAAAQRIKRILQHVFEDSYSFSLEELRKGTLGSAIERLQKIDGVTPFAIAYVVQSALGGHAIPIDSGSMEVLKILQLVTDKDVAAWQVPGLERAIPKSKGIEFGSMLHQLGADFTANPYSPYVHEILLAVDPTAKERLPKRRCPPASVMPEVAQPSQKEAAPLTLESNAHPQEGVAAKAGASTSSSEPPGPEKPRKTRRRKKKTVSPEAESLPPSQPGEKKSDQTQALVGSNVDDLSSSRGESPPKEYHPPERGKSPRRKRPPSTTKLSKKKPR